MTQDNYTDTASAADESNEDSPVIQSLRQQVKDLQKQVKSAPDRDSLEAEIREQLTRDSAIQTQLGKFGHPAGILDVVKGKLGENEVTEDTVAEALTAIGYTVDKADGAPETAKEPGDSRTDLANVTDLSRSVQSAAGSGAPASELSRVQNAQTPEELAAIAAEGGWLKSAY